MDPLTAARAQMEVSLAFHMVFAALGITLPVLLLVAEGLGLRTGKPHYTALAKQWGKATALLFAVGAVSGTALSFELGLLWPEFMAFSGSLIGPAFALEGFAFFIEAIFIGLWLYGWDRLTPRQHWLTGIPIAVSGLLSAVFVVATNAWMQQPCCFEIVDGQVVSTDPLAAFRSPMWWPMAFHLVIGCYVAAAWAVAGVYAWALLRGKRDDYHRAGLAIAMAVAVASTAFLPLSGDVSASAVAEYQPLKLAAMEGLEETQAGAPFTILGLIEIPYLLSLLAARDPFAIVQGLDAFPRDEWPNVTLVNVMFQIMVWSGAVLVAVALWYLAAWWRELGLWPWKRDLPREERRRRAREWTPADRRLLRAILVAAPLGFVGVETGWVVTEAGRQPWTIYGVMLTRDAVTPADGLVATFVAFTILYALLGAVLLWFLRYLARHGPAGQARDEADAALAAREADRGGEGA